MKLITEEKQIVVCGGGDAEYNTYTQDIRCPHKELAKCQKQDVCPDYGEELCWEHNTATMKSVALGGTVLKRKVAPPTTRR